MCIYPYYAKIEVIMGPTWYHLYKAAHHMMKGYESNHRTIESFTPITDKGNTWPDNTFLTVNLGS